MDNLNEFEYEEVYDGADHSKEISDFLNGLDRDSLLKAMAGLQLTAKNHGKSLRLEGLIYEVLSGEALGGNLVKQPDLANFFSAYYLSDYMEDPINSHFTENVLFFGGNYTIFPGSFTDISDKLKAVLEAVFTTENDLDNAFKEKTEQAALLLLTFSSLMASSIGVKRYAADEN